MKKYKFKTTKVKIPTHDCDVELIFPSGNIITIQSRPSNAELEYNGSLDIILPFDQYVTNWKGDDMEPAPASRRAHTRETKQIVMEIP